MLFALQLHQGIDDIDSVAAESLTDGGQDHGGDLVYLDGSSEKLIIAQGYEAERGSRKKAASAAKAAELNQVPAWLLSGRPESLPERLRPHGEEIHRAFLDRRIREVQLWFVHNLPESQNVAAELDATARMTKDILRQSYGDCGLERVIGLEVGVETLYRWYEGSRSPILVTDELSVMIDSFFEVKSGSWRAVCTAVDAAWLQGLYWQHNSDDENRLFSANVRGFVGVKGSKGAINSAIRHTVLEQPENLFVLNNGITALTRDAVVGEPDSSGRRELTLQGLSIVNGAQTTGAVSDQTLRGQTEQAQVLVRFVVSEDPSLVDDVIRSTNSQLATRASDFRSNDRNQLRLIKEFSELGGIIYDGGRRTAPSEITKAPPDNKIAAVTVARALAAFHSDPFLVHADPARIWSDDGLYGSLFGDHTSARHLLFCFSLQRAIERAKREYAAMCVQDPSLTGPKREVHDFLRLRGSVPLLINAVAHCMETLLGRSVPDPFTLAFARKPALDTAVKHWSRVLMHVLPFAPRLAEVLERRVTASGDAGRLERAQLFQRERVELARTLYHQSSFDQVKTAYDIFRSALGDKP
jgi:hypothetical protein